MNAWLQKLHETFIESGYLDFMFEGLKNTVLITLGALAIGIVIGSLIAIIKYKMLDAVTAARNYVVDELSEGIIVVDPEDNISYYNKPGMRLPPLLAPQTVRRVL